MMKTSRVRRISDRSFPSTVYPPRLHQKRACCQEQGEGCSSRAEARLPAPPSVGTGAGRQGHVGFLKGFSTVRLKFLGNSNSHFIPV